MTVITRTIALIFCIALAVFVPAHARAAGPTEAPAKRTSVPTRASDKQAAKRHYDTAQRLFNVGRFREALVHYERAFRAASLPGFLFNIGQCHRNLKQYGQAIFFFRRYLTEAQHATNRVQVEALIVELQQARTRADKAAKKRRLAPVAGAAKSPPTNASTARVSSRPVYKRWWFWTTIAAVTTAGSMIVLRGGTIGGSSGGAIPASDLGNVDFGR